MFFIIGSLADIEKVTFRILFATVSDFKRLVKTPHRSKTTAITEKPIRSLIVQLKRLKVDSGSNFLCQTSAMLDMKVPPRINYQLNIKESTDPISSPINSRTSTTKNN
ncbi:hypothetical protein GEMRC1_002032 [Eukaryota sp. GEM-RC1]